MTHKRKSQAEIDAMSGDEAYRYFQAEFNARIARLSRRWRRYASKHGQWPWGEVRVARDDYSLVFSVMGFGGEPHFESYVSYKWLGRRDIHKVFAECVECFERMFRESSGEEGS